MLAKYSIRAKVISVVAILLVAMIGMGLLAVKNMRSINANTVDIATSWLPSVRVLGELQANVIMNRNLLREHLLAETLDDKLKVPTFDELLKKYDKNGDGKLDESEKAAMKEDQKKHKKGGDKKEETK